MKNIEITEIKFFTVKNKQIWSLAEEYAWKGTGTKSDPLVIDDPRGLTKNLVLRRIDWYIILKNCTFDSVSIESCKNIKVEGSVFKEGLEIFNSGNLIFDGCSMTALSITKCYNSLFRNCSFLYFRNTYSRANAFENCQFDKKFENVILSVSGDEFFFNFIKYAGLLLMSFTPIGIILILVFTHYDPLGFWFHISLSVVSFVLGLYILLSSRHRDKVAERYSPNIIK